MNALINWIRNNPLTLAAGIVAIASLVVMIWFMLGSGELRDNLEREAQAINKLRGYRPVQVDLPPSGPGETAVQASNVMVNAEAIERVQAINGQMAQQSQAVIDAAIQFNQQGLLEGQPLAYGETPVNIARTPMLQGLFPEPANDSIPYRARDTYRAAFPAMLGRWAEGQPGYRLNASMPPSPEEIAARIAEVEADLFQEGERGQLDEAAIEHEQRTKRAALIQLLKERAQQIHVYANTFEQTLPFQIGAWSLGTGQPQQIELWEAQMQLWIQQDLVAAIALANRVWEDAASSSEGTSVINAPVKRIIAMSALPGYVGIHSMGGMGQRLAGSASAGRGGNSFSAAGAGRGGQGSATNSPSNRNFFVAPTGRVSNSMYDVRHALLSIHADVEQIDAIFNALSRINFMTVVDVTMSDVDEAGPDGLAGGYFYGSADVVQLDLVIECVFLRAWTTPLMPEETQDYLGLGS
ncbi:hypothetical protein [Mucisphaera sp.]|uniref:hypothetical protein n=1 Tax=Mucisphaera sp. TaxID=2913024 RepID=UPI003D14B77B